MSTSNSDGVQAGSAGINISAVDHQGEDAGKVQESQQVSQPVPQQVHDPAQPSPPDASAAAAQLVALSALPSDSNGCRFTSLRVLDVSFNLIPAEQLLGVSSPLADLPR